MKKSKRLVSVLLAGCMAISAVLTAEFGAAAAGSSKTLSGKLNYDYSKRVVELVNRERSKNGLSPVEADSVLADGAELRAAECEVSFSHTRPNGASCFTAFRWEGYVGENIAYGQTTPEKVMEGWMNSEGHRANILGKSFTRLGVGCFVSQSGRLYWAQEFSAGKTASAYKRSGTETVSVSVALDSGSETRISRSTTSAKAEQSAPSQKSGSKTSTAPVKKNSTAIKKSTAPVKKSNTVNKKSFDLKNCKNLSDCLRYIICSG